MNEQETKEYHEKLKYLKTWTSNFPIEAAERILELEENKIQLENDLSTHEQILNDQAEQKQKLQRENQRLKQQIARNID